MMLSGTQPAASALYVGLGLPPIVGSVARQTIWLGLLGLTIASSAHRRKSYWRTAGPDRLPTMLWKRRWWFSFSPCWKYASHVHLVPISESKPVTKRVVVVSVVLFALITAGMKMRFKLPPLLTPLIVSAWITPGVKNALSGKIRSGDGPSPPFAGVFADWLCEYASSANQCN